MKAITREWIKKAEGDWATLLREFRVRTDPNYDAVCFHAQQCAEKYLKAWLQEAGVEFKKTHDLEILLNDTLIIEPAWTTLTYGASVLTTYAIKYRYPGALADHFEAKEAVKFSRLIRNTIRKGFGLPNE